MGGLLLVQAVVAQEALIEGGHGWTIRSLERGVASVAVEALIQYVDTVREERAGLLAAEAEEHAAQESQTQEA
jgi:hypothetical protein